MLKKHAFKNITIQELIEQIEAKKRCKIKLSKWFNTENIYYPNKLNIEQTSSEITAEYKANIIHGESIIDITGGFGVDCLYFSKKYKNVYHCEINSKLSQIVSHNYNQLNIKNITTVCNDGLVFLKESNKEFDVIYIDPSRRNDKKGKVFLLSDCLPNVPENIDFLFKKSNKILIKTSPLLDLSNAINELKYVKEIHIVAVKNEVKELLFNLEKGFTGKINIITANLNKGKNEAFRFSKENNNSLPNYGTPKKYLYEPNAAILKSGGFNQVALQFNLLKLHQHSHLYTNEKLVPFPGRSFEIVEVLDYNKKILKKRFKKQKFNVTTRNFPKSVENIRKELDIRDGGEQYLFFTTNTNNEKIVVLCNKIPK